MGKRHTRRFSQRLCSSPIDGEARLAVGTIAAEFPQRVFGGALPRRHFGNEESAPAHRASFCERREERRVATFCHERVRRIGERHIERASPPASRRPREGVRAHDLGTWP